MTQPALQHNKSVSFDSAKVASEAFAPPGLPAGARIRALRRLEDGVLRSGIVHLSAGWTSPPLSIVGGPQQYFVLSGELRVGDALLRSPAFFSGFAGEILPPLRAETDVEMIAIFDAAPAYAPAKPGAKTARIIADIDAITPVTPEIKGVKLKGFERRVVWENPANGADTRFLRIPAGFEGRGPNYHPVHEEIFHIAGDGGPDDSRRLTTGWYLWNPAYTVHGYHEHSAEGMVLLEWHDGKWAYIPYEGEARG